jgi:tetratricopeptide (TPR) repeat protein
MDDSINQSGLALGVAQPTMAKLPAPDSLADAIAKHRQGVMDAALPVEQSGVASGSTHDDAVMVQQCEHLLAAHPADADLWYRRGEALANLGEHAAALQSFRHTLELASERVDAWIFQAVMLIQLGRNQEALESAEQAIALHPENEEAWTFKGVALRYLGRYQEAYACYDRALGVERPPSLWKRLTQVLQGWF